MFFLFKRLSVSRLDSPHKNSLCVTDSITVSDSVITPSYAIAKKKIKFYFFLYKRLKLLLIKFFFKKLLNN